MPPTTTGTVLRSCRTSHRGLQREDVLAWPPALRRRFPRPSLCSSPAQGPAGCWSQLAETTGFRAPKVGGKTSPFESYATCCATNLAFTASPFTRALSIEPTSPSHTTSNSLWSCVHSSSSTHDILTASWPRGLPSESHRPDSLSPSLRHPGVGKASGGCSLAHSCAPSQRLPASLLHRAGLDCLAIRRGRRSVNRLPGPKWFSLVLRLQVCSQVRCSFPGMQFCLCGCASPHLGYDIVICHW